jgi:hypothetical protein
MKLRVLYCDDNKKYLQEFRERHREDFDVEVTSDIGGLYNTLTSRRRSELPDVLLLDLYHPGSPGELTARQREIHDAAEAKLAALREMIADVREAVNRAWSPEAINVLQELRHVYSANRLPIMIYTQRGLLLLNDDELKAIEQSEAEWLLKDPARISSGTETMRIRRFVERSRESGRLARDIKLALWSIVGSALLGAALGALTTVLLT